MKKKTGLIVAACMAFAVSACAAGCSDSAPESHEHSYAAAWSSDESYHWHECTSTVGTCDAPVNGKAEHSWDEGVITQEATAEADGVKTYTCTVCSKTKTETVKYVAPAIELKEDSDFSALISEQVTEDEWKAAFEIENVSIKVHDNYYDTPDMKIKFCNGEIYACVIGAETQYFYYFNKLSDGTIVYSNGGETISVAPDNESYQSVLTGYNYALNWNYPDFSEFYSSFTYDSVKGTYILNSEVTTSSSVFDGNSMRMDFAEIKIINGKLAYLRYGNYDEGTTVLNDETEYFYDFGVTEITLPVAPAIELKEDTDFSALISEQVTEDEWKAAFEIENVTIKIFDNTFDGELCAFIKRNSSEFDIDIGTPIYMNKLSDGTLEYSYGDEPIDCIAPGDDGYELELENYEAGNYCYPDFSDFYSSFTYDSAKGVYVLNQTVTSNSVLELWDFNYDFAELKIINGKLAYIRWGDYSEGTTVLNDKTEYFYDFGVTEITLPTAE